MGIKPSDKTMSHSEPRQQTQAFINQLVPHQHRIQAFITMLVPNISDAEDVYQETLAEMWNKYDRFESGTNFLAWSLKIAKYKIYSYRKKAYSGKMIFSDRIFELIDAVADRKVNGLGERLDMLRECVKRLSSRETSLLKLRYEHELTFKKISERVGKSPPNIHHAIAVILSKLALCVRHHLRLEEQV